MNTQETILELSRIWVSRKASNWAATMLMLAGLGELTQEWWFGIANAITSTLLDRQLEPFQPSPSTGWILLSLGLGFVLLSIWESKRTKNKEIIAIRHKSLGKFPKGAIKADLPFVRRLWDYREIDIDHTDSYLNGVLNDHDTVVRRIERAPIELDSLLSTKPDSPVAYYGLTHIPLAFYLGYQLSDSKYQIQLFELNNTSGRWDQLNGLSTPVVLIADKSTLARNDNSGDVIMSIGISYPVQQSEIDELGLSNILGQVSLNAETPQRQLITNDTQIDQICAEFKTMLEHIKNTCPNREKIHLFYSGPVSLCFALGRCISERIDSEVISYNYSVKETPKYNWALSLNGTTTKFTNISQIAA